MTTTTRLDRATLPTVVARYLEAHVAQDFATAVTYLAEDVTVVDDGHTLEGRAATLALFDASARQFRVTMTLGAVTQPAEGVWEVGSHLSGDFPGGEVDLRMIFSVAGDRIQRLEITV